MVLAIDNYDYTGRQIKRRQNSKKTNKQTNKQTSKKSKILKFNRLTTTSRTNSIFAVGERIQNKK